MLIATKLNMPFNRSTCSNPNVIPELEERQRLLRRTDAMKESFYHMARASKDILEQEAGIMDARNASFVGQSRQNAASVNEDRDIEDEESGFDCDRAEPTKYQTQDFVTCW